MEIYCVYCEVGDEILFVIFVKSVAHRLYVIVSITFVNGNITYLLLKLNSNSPRSLAHCIRFCSTRDRHFVLTIVATADSCKVQLPWRKTNKLATARLQATRAISIDTTAVAIVTVLRLCVLA